MTISEHVESFGGKEVEDFDPELGIEDPAGVAYRVSVDFDALDAGRTIREALGELLEQPGCAQLEALVIGQWDYDSSRTSAEVVEVLCGNRDLLPELRNLFIGDIVCEEQEISWIQQSDLTPILAAFPELVELRIRGGERLSLQPVSHEKLEKLTIESGGLGRSVVAAIAGMRLPRLTHLELWLGDDNYGYENCLRELAPILAGEVFPSLVYLGLKNCCEQDAIARAVADAPILDRLKVLDLGMGTLSDEGAAALLASRRIRNLERLSLAYHFLSERTVTALRRLGIEVDASDPQEPDRYDGEEERYVSVGE